MYVHIKCMLKYFMNYASSIIERKHKCNAYGAKNVKLLFHVVIAKPAYKYEKKCMSRYFSSGVNIKEIPPSSGHATSAVYPRYEYTF